jgi:hypothetical protein
MSSIIAASFAVIARFISFGLNVAWLMMETIMKAGYSVILTSFKRWFTAWQKEEMETFTLPEFI